MADQWLTGDGKKGGFQRDYKSRLGNFFSWHNVHYFYCGNVFLDVHICQVIQSSYFKYVKLIVCELYANTVVYKIKLKCFCKPFIKVIRRRRSRKMRRKKRNRRMRWPRKKYSQLNKANGTMSGMFSKSQVLFTNVMYKIFDPFLPCW